MSGMTSVHEDPSFATVLRLPGSKTILLHPKRTEDEAHIGGGDFDCVVFGLDLLWPLRLSDGWRICQCFHYDITGWYWVIEKKGHVIAVDTLDDSFGLGKYGFPTTLVSEEEELVAAPAVRAAYLTAKRLRKRISEDREWSHVGSLARQDRERYLEALAAIIGAANANELGEVVLNDLVPDPVLRKRARTGQFVRRFRSPYRAVTICFLQASRLVTRVARPTGLTVVLAGPDGSGKSTLAVSLLDVCEDLFRRCGHVHWRPGLLPDPGRILRRPPGDSSNPHARRQHGRGLSTLLLGYYWLDFVAGELFKMWPLRVRSGLAVVERGWWDLAVDPRRYRLRVPRQLVRFLGSLLKSPDLVVILESTADVLLRRKRELPAHELSEQGLLWRNILPSGVTRLFVDGSLPPERIVERVHSELIAMLETRSLSRLGGGWAGLPSRSRPRWWLPRGPRAAARSGLLVYQPVTRRGRLGWEAARLMAKLGGFRLLLRGEPPPDAVRTRLANHLPQGSTLAVARANHPGRFLALVVDQIGNCVSIAKLAFDASGEVSLEREVTRINELATLLPAPLSAPRVLHYERGLLLLEAVQWLPRRRPWELPEEVAHALGAFHRQTDGDLLGPTHGDCAPWNLLRAKNSWVLVDWEKAEFAGPAFFDVFHFLVQSHDAFRRPSYNAIVDGLKGKGKIGQVFLAYARGGDYDLQQIPKLFDSYLEITKAGQDRRGILIRQKLLDRGSSKDHA
jgi:hypothetical protein